MYKNDLVLNNQQWLICHKMKKTNEAKKHPWLNYLHCSFFSTKFNGLILRSFPIKSDPYFTTKSKKIGQFEELLRF